MSDEKVLGGTEQKELLSAKTVSSTHLLQGQKELVITHGSETYRLRLTRNNKLILTK